MAPTTPSRLEAVIMTLSSLDAGYVRRLTSTLPIVTVYSGMDPVADGLIASFARPGGNVTGVSRMLGETRAKRLELIKTLLPAASRVGVLLPSESLVDAGQTKTETVLRGAAQVLRLEVQFYRYRSVDDLLVAFPALAAAHTQAFLLGPTFQVFASRARIAEVALQHRLPGVFTLREYAMAGGLMSYGPDLSAIVRQLAQQVDRILRDGQHQKRGDNVLGRVEKSRSKLVMVSPAFPWVASLGRTGPGGPRFPGKGTKPSK